MATRLVAAAITQGAGKLWPRIWIGPAPPALPPNHFTLIVVNTVPSSRLWIERSLVPAKIVVMASITCDRPKNRMIDSISGLLDSPTPGTTTPQKKTARQQKTHKQS